MGYDGSPEAAGRRSGHGFYTASGMALGSFGLLLKGYI